MIKKLTSASGLTMVELMVSIAILIMVTGCVTLGISIGYKAYGNILFESESQVLVSDIETVTEDILKVATVDDTAVGDTADADGYYTVSGFNSVETYISGTGEEYYKYGIKGGSILTKNGKLYYTTTVYNISEKKYEGKDIPLINEGMYKDMTVSDVSLKYDKNGHFRFRFTVNNKDGKTKNSGWYYVASPNAK